MLQYLNSTDFDRNAATFDAISAVVNETVTWGIRKLVMLRDVELIRLGVERGALQALTTMSLPSLETKILSFWRKKKTEMDHCPSGVERRSESDFSRKAEEKLSKWL